MEQPPDSNQTRSNDGASKKKYAVMYGYCGTGYQGSQTYLTFYMAYYIAIRALIRLMMI